MNGMDNINELCFLQVQGKNQLKKEIDQLKDAPKNINWQALHRNEQTNEMERMEDEQASTIVNTPRQKKNKREKSIGSDMGSIVTSIDKSPMSKNNALVS